MFYDFLFDGQKISDYGMIVCNIDKTSGVEVISSGSDITFNQVKPSSGNIFNIASSTYESPLSNPIQICKNPCIFKTQEDMFLTVDEVSALQRWLCRKNEYKRFQIDDDKFKNIYWNGTFSAKQIVLNSQIIGLELTLYTDSPYAYMNEVTIEHDCLAGASFDLYDNSDEVTDISNQVRPYVEISISSDGDFKLSNSMDEKYTVIKNCKKGEVIKLNGKNKIITSSNSSHTLSSDFNFYFPRIINTYTERCNTFKVNLDCKIKIIYSPIRKIGLV